MATTNEQRRDVSNRQRATRRNGLYCSQPQSGHNAKMIVVFPFSTVDQNLALKNAKWINELGGCDGHEVVVCYDVRCNSDTIEAVGQEMLVCFDKVYRIPAQAAIDGWPEGANYLFRLVNAWLAANPRFPYFFWMEPDAIPLRRGWLEAIVEAHTRGGKPFMGDRVEVEDIPLHMSGVGVYPNPIYILAGEAYRAFDVAWDMAAKDQIIPNAHFTRLIEHAWKHPGFTSSHELTTQIRPEAVLFHASKDGSLIDILRKQKGGDASLPNAHADMTPGIRPEPDIRSVVQPSVLLSDAAPNVQPAGAAPIYDILIRTYPGDYEWLAYCVLSIHKFCTGFRKIWVISPGPQPSTVKGVEWKVMNDETQDGYLAQQITKLYADVFNDYQADHILHVDSDVILTRPTTPQDFFKNGKLIWYFTPFEAIQTPWKPIMEKFMGFTMPFEFMRRLPMMLPRWLYPRLREFCFHIHRVPLCDYVKAQPQRAFSEFNALGCYAYFHFKNEFEWVNTIEAAMPPTMAKQFHSWSGLTPEIKSEIETILSGGLSKPEVQSKGDLHINRSVDTRNDSDERRGTRFPAAQIKILPNDTWVLENDQISQWVEQEGRLDHDQNLLPDILKHIKPGDRVIDAGAFIGDHTVAYSEAVGAKGMVYAFEPNPIAFRCLEHNVEGRKNIRIWNHGLSNKTEVVPLSGNNDNAGGAYVGEHMKVADVQMYPLQDKFPWHADFIKIDVEGYELKVLQGAELLIKASKPIMVIEINSGALKRQGFSPEDIRAWLKEHNYESSIMQSNAKAGDPLFDILCVPVKQPSEIPKSGATVHAKPEAPQPPPPVAAISTPGQMREYVERLKEFAQSSTHNKMLVMRHLSIKGMKVKHREPEKKK
jgi:FkbM family methyltransferase